MAVWRADRGPSAAEIGSRRLDAPPSSELQRGARFAAGDFRELPSGVDEHDLARAGWGVIYAREDATVVEQGLHRLLEHRRSQAGERFKRIVYPRYQTVSDFLRDHEEVPGTIDPARLPYYLLIVGSPVTVPFELQFQLAINHAVGRLDFDSGDDLERYADTVVAFELGEKTLDEKPLAPRAAAPRAAILEVDNREQGSSLLRKHLVPPLERYLGKSGAGEDRAGEVITEPGWTLERWRGEDATRAGLIRRLTGPPPALLIAACHGFETAAGHPDQEAVQGALVCEDWQPGEEPAVEHCLTAGDLAGDLDGLIAFSLACYGAGTPQLGHFAHELQRTTPEKAGIDVVAADPFVAALAREMLRRGALAVVGHVDLSWVMSFSWPENPESEQTVASLIDALGRLRRGDRLGHALRPLHRRYTALAARLLDLQRRRFEGDEVSDQEFGRLWTAHLDARDLIVLGDPAVYLGGRRPRAELSRTATEVEAHADHPASFPAADERPRSAAAPPLPDLILFVRHQRTRHGARLTFTSVLQGKGELEPEQVEFGIDDRKYLDEQFRAIEGAPQQTADDRFALETRLDGIGRKLFTQLLPAGLRQRLWRLHRQWRQQRDVERTVLVISDEVWIPWQMLKLHDPADPHGDEPFLGQVWGLARWPWPDIERLEDHLALPLAHPALVVTGDSRLPHGQVEKAMLEDLYRQHGRTAEVEVPATVQAIVEEMKRGARDGWHFSGHGVRWGESGDQWSLVLANQTRFDADHLESVGAASLGRARPLVFLNACHSGAGAPSLGRMGGLASTLLRLGAGAFLGAAWKTRDDAAAEFARLFYHHFLGGCTVAEAVRRARLGLRENRDFDGDASWLTYTVFAHPLARCAASVGTPAERPIVAVSKRVEERLSQLETVREVPPTRKPTVGAVVGLILGLLLFGLLHAVTVPSRVELELWLSEIEFTLSGEEPQPILGPNLVFDFLEVESFRRASFVPEQQEAIVMQAAGERPRIAVEALDGVQGLLTRQNSASGRRVRLRVDGGEAGADLTWWFTPEGGSVDLKLPARFSLSASDVEAGAGGDLGAAFAVHPDLRSMSIEAMDDRPLMLTIGVPPAPDRSFSHTLLTTRPQIHRVVLYHQGLGKDRVSSLRRDGVLTFLDRPSEPSLLDADDFAGLEEDAVWTLQKLDLVRLEPERERLPEEDRRPEAMLYGKLVGETGQVKTRAGDLDPVVHRTSLARRLSGGHPLAGWILVALLASALGTLAGWWLERHQSGR